MIESALRKAGASGDEMAAVTAVLESGELVGEADGSIVVNRWIRFGAGVSAWFACLFLIAGFVALLDTTGSYALGGIGIVLYAGGLWLLAQKGGEARANSVFIAQFGFALALTGNGLILVAIGDGSGWRNDSYFPVYAALTAAQAILALVALRCVPESRLGLLGIVFTTCWAIAWAVELDTRLSYATLITMLALAFAVALHFRPGSVNLATGLGLSVALALIALEMSVDGFYLIGRTASHWEAGPAMTGLFALAFCLYAPAVFRRSWAVIAAAILIVAAGWIATPAILCGFSLILIGRTQGLAILLMIGLILLPTSLAFYYTALDLSTLLKSASLMGHGVILLGFSWYLSRFYFDQSTNKSTTG